MPFKQSVHKGTNEGWIHLKTPHRRVLQSLMVYKKALKYRLLKTGERTQIFQTETNELKQNAYFAMNDYWILSNENVCFLTWNIEQKVSIFFNFFLHDHKDGMATSKTNLVLLQLDDRTSIRCSLFNGLNWS